MVEPVWLSRLVIDSMQLDQIREHGGQAGIRDENLLESSLARPRNKLAYEPSAELAELAAAYGFGLARNHPYLDGNKRVAFVAMYVFLGLNGVEVEADEPEVVKVMLSVAGGDMTESELASWIRAHSVNL